MSRKDELRGKAPEQVGDAVVFGMEEIAGYHIPVNGEAAVILQIDGEAGAILYCVPIFSTLEKLSVAAVAYGFSDAEAYPVASPEEFLTVIEGTKDLKVILDPWTTPDGTVRYVLVAGHLPEPSNDAN